jgi:hypothetical protein
LPAKSFVVGALEANHVAVKIFGYEAPLEAEAKDANWLSAEIRVSAGSWSGRVRDAFITTAEIRAFRENAEKFVAGAVTEANFEPMEPHLILKLSADSGERVQVSGVAFDQPEGVNAIAFNWQVEPAQLHLLVKQLKSVEEEFPPR